MRKTFWVGALGPFLKEYSNVAKCKKNMIDFFCQIDYCAEVVGYWGIKPLRRFPCWGVAVKAPLLPPLVPLIKNKDFLSDWLLWNKDFLSIAYCGIKISCQIGYCEIKNKHFLSDWLHVKYRIKISCQIGYCVIKNKDFLSDRLHLE